MGIGLVLAGVATPEKVGLALEDVGRVDALRGRDGPVPLAPVHEKPAWLVGHQPLACCHAQQAQLPYLHVTGPQS